MTLACPYEGTKIWYNPRESAVHDEIKVSGALDPLPARRMWPL